MRFVLVLFFLTAHVRAESIEPCEGSLAPPTRAKKTNISREAKGYSILVTTMVATAVGTTYLTSLLPQEFAFLSQFVAQMSTLGVYVFGAPIWEPLASGFRKAAFGVNRRSQTPGAARDDGLWRRTQEHYSLNEQMSRNVRAQALLLTQANFYEAYRAYHFDQQDYAADQLAVAAVRLRKMFAEIEPDDRAIAQAVRTAFTLHVHLSADFVGRVRTRLFELDPVGQAYHDQIVRNWLSLDNEVL